MKGRRNRTKTTADWAREFCDRVCPQGRCQRGNANRCGYGKEFRACRWYRAARRLATWIVLDEAEARYRVKYLRLRASASKVYGTAARAIERMLRRLAEEDRRERRG